MDEAGRRAATAAIRQRAGRVILRPDPAAVLERNVMLPLAAEHDVSRVLRYEMDRLTPFTAEQVFWSATSSAATGLRGGWRSACLCCQSVGAAGVCRDRSASV